MARVDKSPARVRAMFDQITPQYDALNRLLSMRLDLQWRRAAARELAGAGRVLDLCAGTGDMAAAAGTSRCVAADFALAMLRRAGAKFPRLRRTAADASSLPFRNASFDAATVAFGVRNFADLDRGLAELRRVIRPGGRVVILELTPPPAGLAPLLACGVPFLGRLLTRGRIHAYRYLAESIAGFLDGPSLTARLQRAGFADARHRPLTMGLCALVTGT